MAPLPSTHTIPDCPGIELYNIGFFFSQHPFAKPTTLYSNNLHTKITPSYLAIASQKFLMAWTSEKGNVIGGGEIIRESSQAKDRIGVFPGNQS